MIVQRPEARAASGQADRAGQFPIPGGPAVNEVNPVLADVLANDLELPSELAKREPRIRWQPATRYAGRDGAAESAVPDRGQGELASGGGQAFEEVTQHFLRPGEVLRFVMDDQEAQSAC